MANQKIGIPASWRFPLCWGVVGADACAAPPSSPAKLAAFPPVNTRIGSAAVSSQYRFTTEPSVVEQARLHVQMGAEAIKFQGLGPRYRVKHQRLFPRPEKYAGRRSVNWIAALNTKSFRTHELSLRDLAVVDETIYRKYMPWIDPTMDCLGTKDAAR